MLNKGVHVQGKKYGQTRAGILLFSLPMADLVTYRPQVYRLGRRCIRFAGER